jgi:hypothetical protein
LKSPLKISKGFFIGMLLKHLPFCLAWFKKKYLVKTSAPFCVTCPEFTSGASGDAVFERTVFFLKSGGSHKLNQQISRYAWDDSCINERRGNEQGPGRQNTVDKKYDFYQLLLRL